MEIGREKGEAECGAYPQVRRAPSGGGEDPTREEEGEEEEASARLEGMDKMGILLLASEK